MAEPVQPNRTIAEPPTRHPADVAAIISALNDTEALELLRRLAPRQEGADALGEMEPEEAARLYAGLARGERLDILRRMAPDDAADLLGELPPEMAQEVLGRLDAEDARALRTLLAYAPDTAGGLMSPEVVTVPDDATVQQTIERLRRQAAEAETMYYAYVVDQDHRLHGVLALRDLVLAPPGQPIRDLVRREVVTLPPEMDAEEVLRLFDKYNYLALPVVDAHRRLLGIVTVDDVMDRMREETTEDILRMGGIPSGEEHPLEPVRGSIRKRLPWMMLNMVIDLVAVSAVALFEPAIAQFAFLAVLMPIVSDMGGNVAMQAMSVAIRGMSTGQADWTHRLQVLRKELIGGFINGLVLGLEIGLIAWLWRGNLWLGGVAMTALWINTIIAAALGSYLPFLMKRLKLDPALVSSSIITSLTDLTGFSLFLGMATWMLARMGG